MYEIILILISIALVVGYKYQMKHGGSGTVSDLFNAVLFLIFSAVIAVLDFVALIAWLWNHFSYV